MDSDLENACIIQHPSEPIQHTPPDFKIQHPSSDNTASECSSLLENIGSPQFKKLAISEKLALSFRIQPFFDDSLSYYSPSLEKIAPFRKITLFENAFDPYLL